VGEAQEGDRQQRESSSPVNTLRPPKRSVRTPIGTRMSAPSKVGSAINKPIDVLSRLKSACI
jgi:hypothetical protein